MWARGTEIEWAVALIKIDGIPSGPGDVLRGREEMRSITVSSEQRSSEQEEVEFRGGKKVCGVESLVKSLQMSYSEDCTCLDWRTFLYQTDQRQGLK